jgi:hypothetical protein
MRRICGIALTVSSLVALACGQTSTPGTEHQTAKPRSAAPAGFQKGDRSDLRPITLGKVAVYPPIQGSSIELSAIVESAPAAIELGGLEGTKKDSRPELPISQAEADRRRAEALGLSPNPGIQHLARRGSGGGNSPLKVRGSFESITGSEACGPCVTTPPDPEMAVGPDHIVAGVNVAMMIYDKQGNLLTGPVYMRDLFGGVPGCRPRYFDPTVVYDEKEDRFVFGIDVAGAGFCVAASATSDPTGAWHRYFVQAIADPVNDFFDYPHLGVGRDAVYLGATNFMGATDAEGRVWALDKASLYSGGPLQVVSRQLGFNVDTNPQPMHVHGARQGTWPTSGPHYFITDDVYDGATYGVVSWANPFDGQGGQLVRRGVVDLNAATGVVAGYPVNIPQKDGVDLWGNDHRAQDAELRNGDLWFTTTVACNPGSGTVNCARWARIDPARARVLEAGIAASDDGTHRAYNDLDVDHCGNMVMGYSIGSAGSWPGIAVAGRRKSDPPGTLRPEIVLAEGEAVYTGFDGVPLRWGDYTEMAVDPNGEDFYYFNEYAKAIDYPNASYGTKISKLTFKCKAKNKD